MSKKIKNRSGSVQKPINSSSSEVRSAQEEAKKIIEDANREREKIINDAKRNAESNANHIKEMAETNARNEKQKILEDIQKREILLKNKEDEIEKEKTKIEQDKKSIADDVRKEMKQEIEMAKDEADSIRKNADEYCRKKDQELDKERSELKSQQSEYTRKLAELEVLKIKARTDAEKNVQDELNYLSEKCREYSQEVSNWKRQYEDTQRKYDIIKADLTSYEEIITEFDEASSQNTGYKYRIESLNKEISALKEIIDEYSNKLSEQKKVLLLFGDNPEELIHEIEDSRNKIERLETIVSNTPSESDLRLLRENNELYKSLQKQYSSLENEKFALEAQLKTISVNRDELENYKLFVKILELQKTELQKELSQFIQLYESRSEKIFANLSRIDEISPAPIETTGSFTLKALCDDFRNYLSNRKENQLYYTPEIIRTFIAGFASSRLMILEGLSGTGKSSLPRAFKDYFGAETIEVPVQSSWKDRNDLLGFYNDFKKQYKETEFLKAVYQATHDHDRIYCIVLDEMNLSRIEYYFADLLSVLEKPNPEKWEIELISDFASIRGNPESWPNLIHEGKLRICDNTWFIGTANKDDSTFTITDKVYDRSVVINFESKGEKDQSSVYKKPITLTNEDFLKLLNNVEWNSRDKDRFKSMIKILDDKVKVLFQITFGNRIENQLEKFVPVYVACGGTVDEAVDVMFSRKILRKLEGIYDEGTKDSLGKLRKIIQENGFEMPNTLKHINIMESKI